jgi:hypothetical protein
MRACASARTLAAALLVPGLLAAGLSLGGCQPGAAGGEFEIEAVRARWGSGRIEVRCEQDLRLSEAARDALGHGVPLTVELEVILRSAADQTRIARHRSEFEIRYLPMSEHYQVSRLADGPVRTYPRLRHALADLSRVNVTLETGALPAGDYELLARTRLDRDRMPPPMRLPVLFDSAWTHVSTWTSWPLVIDPGA